MCGIRIHPSLHQHCGDQNHPENTRNVVFAMPSQAAADATSSMAFCATQAAPSPARGNMGSKVSRTVLNLYIISSSLQLKPSLNKEGATSSFMCCFHFTFGFAISVSDEACTDKCSSNQKMINWTWTRAITCCMVAVVPPAFPKCKHNALHVSSYHVL